MSVPIRTPPGPRGLPLLGSLPSLFKDPLRLFLQLSQDYGPIAYCALGKVPLYVLSEPALIEEFLLEQHASCIKDLTTRLLNPLLGNGLLTSEHDFWKRQRKLASPPLQPKRISSYASTMVECAARQYDSFRDGETRDFHVDSMQLTLEIAGKTLLGVSTAEESARISKAVEASVGYFSKRLYAWTSLIPPSVPLPSTLRFRRAKSELDRIVTSLIARSRQDAASADHLLARLINARTPEGEAMSEQQLLDEALTMLLAGHETTALALMYAAYALSENPAVADKLRAEIDSQLGTRAATSDDLVRMPYLDAVVRETLRLYPPAYTFGREVVRELTLGGYPIPVGSQVLVSPYGLHRNARFFPEPERFRPERWQTAEARALPRMAYIPFGAGPRICIGSHFAMMETALLLATLVQHVELFVRPGFALELQPVITMRSAHGLPVQVRRRSSPEQRPHALA